MGRENSATSCQIMASLFVVLVISLSTSIRPTTRSLTMAGMRILTATTVGASLMLVFVKSRKFAIIIVDLIWDTSLLPTKSKRSKSMNQQHTCPLDQGETCIASKEHYKGG